MTLDLAKLRELEAAATPAPWRVVRHYEAFAFTLGARDGWNIEAGGCVACTNAIGPTYDRKGESDAALVAAARNALPELIATVERLRTERDARLTERESVTILAQRDAADDRAERAEADCETAKAQAERARDELDSMRARAESAETERDSQRKRADEAEGELSEEIASGKRWKESYEAASRKAEALEHDAAKTVKFLADVRAERDAALAIARAVKKALIEDRVSGAAEHARRSFLLDRFWPGWDLQPEDAEEPFARLDAERRRLFEAVKEIAGMSPAAGEAATRARAVLREGWSA